MSGSRYEDGSYLAANPGWHEAEAMWKAGLVREIVQVEPASVVDVGCGTGGVLASLRKFWPSSRLVGYDIASVAPDDRRAELDVRVGGVPDIQERFDLALALDVFEHVEDYMGFLRSLARVAGRVCFHIPLDLSAQTVLRAQPLIRGRTAIGHLHYFSVATAIATLEDTGYQIVRKRLVAAGSSERQWERRTRVAGVPRRALARVAGDDLAARALGGYTLMVLASTAGEQSQ